MPHRAMDADDFRRVAFRKKQRTVEVEEESGTEEHHSSGGWETEECNAMFSLCYVMSSS